MNPYLSRKLKYISFTLILMVVFLHAHNNSSGQSDPLNYYVQNFISNGFTKISVALFFLISGYLFFVNIPDAKLADFGRKIQARFRTILLPYLLWSIWGMLFFLILQLIPFSRAYFNSNLILESSVSDLLHTLFVKPLPYQLWFLRHLFVFVLISPIIYLIGKYARFVLLAIIAILLLKVVEIPTNDFVQNRSLAYFCLGCYAGMYLQYLVLERWAIYAWLALGLWIVLLFNRIALESQTWINHRIWRNFIQHAEYLIGIFAVWSLYDFFSSGATIKKIPHWLTFSFFLYAAHEPILTLIKKLLFIPLSHQSPVQTLIAYFLAPILTIALCIAAAIFLRKKLPELYSFMTGGR